MIEHERMMVGLGLERHARYSVVRLPAPQRRRCARRLHACVIQAHAQLMEVMEVMATFAWMCRWVARMLLPTCSAGRSTSQNMAALRSDPICHAMFPSLFAYKLHCLLL